MRRVLRTWAENAAAFASELAGLDASWGTETFELAGGRAVLCGPGLYVNRAIAVGLDGPLSDEQVELFEARCAVVGVPPAVEVTEATHDSVAPALRARGYVLDGTTSALRRGLDDIDQLAPSDSTIRIEPANLELLTVWQQTSALGWGHLDGDARRASDVFARVAAEVDGDGLVLASDAHDGRPVGCASLSIRNGVATLGGMSTVPSERGRGVQRAMILHRLRVARDQGCDIVTSSAVPGGASERNLIRHGFVPWFDVSTLARPAPALGD
jgi:GNAT superfamily N-acetyltransferase